MKTTQEIITEVNKDWFNSTTRELLKRALSIQRKDILKFMKSLENESTNNPNSLKTYEVLWKELKKHIEGDN